MAGPFLSIIIPAYNEAARLLPTLEKIDQFARKQSFAVEVIVVDDGSTDATAQVAADFARERPQVQLLRNPANIGKGGSIKNGMLAARGRFRLFTDADLSTPIEETGKFLCLLSLSGPEANGPQIAIGSRRLRGAQISVRQPFYREAAGRVFSVLVRLFLLCGFLDTQCGFKMFTDEAAQNIFPRLTINRFGFDIEMLFIAQKVFGYEVKEVPVAWRDSPATKVSLARDSLQMFLDILRIRWKWLRGVYQAF